MVGYSGGIISSSQLGSRMLLIKRDSGYCSCNSFFRSPAFVQNSQFLGRGMLSVKVWWFNSKSRTSEEVGPRVQCQFHASKASQFLGCGMLSVKVWWFNSKSRTDEEVGPGNQCQFHASRASQFLGRGLLSVIKVWWFNSESRSGEQIIYENLSCSEQDYTQYIKFPCFRAR